jgi:hypothetical protein
MIPIPTKGVGELAERLFVRIPRLRAVFRLRTIKDQIAFAVEYELILPEQQAELAEMLLGGAPLSGAISELRATRGAS